MKVATAVMIAALGLPAAAWAQSSPSGGDDVTVTLMPYGWLAGVSGPADVSSGGPRPEIDSDSSGIFDNLNFFGFGVGEVSKGNLGAMVDISYVSMTFGEDLNLPPAFPLGGDLDLDGAVVTLDGFYRFKAAEDFDVDVIGGVRIYSVDLGLRVHGPAGTTLFKGEAEDTWADAVIGGRARWTPGRWTFSAQGDIGGGSDTSSWGAVLMADYRLTDHFGLMGGYRWLNFDHDKDGRDLDLTLEGPMIGASWTF